LSHLFSIPLSIANLTNNTKTIRIAETKPKYPISSAIVVSLFYKGVVSSTSAIKRVLIFPKAESSPTAIITTFPSPERTLVPDRTIGEGTL